MRRKYDPEQCPVRHCDQPTRNFGDVRPKRWAIDARPYNCTRHSPTTCHGDSHSPDCRPGRPLCRVMRDLINATCICGAYSFPHRRGGGRCGRLDEVWGAEEAKWQAEQRAVG